MVKWQKEKIFFVVCLRASPTFICFQHKKYSNHLLSTGQGWVRVNPKPKTGSFCRPHTWEAQTSLLFQSILSYMQLVWHSVNQMLICICHTFNSTVCQQGFLWPQISEAFELRVIWIFFIIFFLTLFMHIQIYSHHHAGGQKFFKPVQTFEDNHLNPLPLFALKHVHGIK